MPGAMPQRLGEQAIGGQAGSEACVQTGVTNSSHSELCSVACYHWILDTFLTWSLSFISLSGIRW